MTTLINADFLAGGGELASLIRSRDWTASPLGNPTQWPAALRTIASFMLKSPFPMAVAWGDELVTLYNDAYTRILGDKHPAALGRPFSDVWSDRWEHAAPVVANALAGESVFLEDIPYVVARDGRDTCTWITYSCSPVCDEEGRIRGVSAVCLDTTDKVLMERNRLEENERLQQLFQQAPSLIAVLRGPDHVFEIANAAYLQLLGQRDLIGKPVRMALPELAEQGFVDLLDQVYRTGEAFVGSAVPIAVRRGQADLLEERLFDFVYQPIRDSAGRVSGIFGEGIDVTERVLAERALRESEAQIRQLANTIPQMAWMADASGAIHWYNDRWYEYTGTTPEEMTGWGWQRVHSPEFLPKVLAHWKHSLETGESFEMVFPLRGKDGQFRQFYTLVAPLRDLSGKISQWFGTNTDVSSLHRAQEELRQTEAWLQDSLAAGRMVALDWDLQTQGVKYSANSQEVLGYSGSHAASGWNSIHPDDHGRLTEAVNRAIGERSSYNELTRRIRPDTGELIWVETKGRILCDAQGEAAMVRGIIIDVTQRVTAEIELKEANRRKDEFLAMLAHELRNPLAPISTAAHLLKFAGNDARRIGHASDVIGRQVKHMTELVDDLLDVSRVTRGLVELQFEHVDLKTVIAGAVEQARPLIESRNHRLDIRLAAAPAFVRGDRTRLIQVFANLLNNACKYTPPGGEIGLALEVLDDQVKVTVSDNGSGIAPSLLPYIFDLFTQGERTPDRAQGGLGLGLALVKSIIGLHEGRIEARSGGAGKGSAFAVHVPMLAQELQPASPAPVVPAPALRGNALRLLVVDDNVDAAEMLALALEAAGHRVTVAASAQPALDMAVAAAPEVCILDIGLPDMDGYELARRLRVLPAVSGALFVALTGYGQDHDRALSKEAGFDHHLVKPVNLEQLHAVLSAFARTR